MDFAYSDEQEAIRDLARKIFSERVSHEHSRDLEKSGEWFDLDLWNELAKLNVTTLTLPESVGGADFGVLEATLVLEEMGRGVAPVPLLPTLMLAGLPIARFGSEAQQERWLAPVAQSHSVLTAALQETGGVESSPPRTTARRDGDGWRLDGEKTCVPAAHLASCILVPARTDDGGTGVFLIDPGATGVRLERQTTTNHEPQSRLELEGVRVTGDDALGDPAAGKTTLAWIREHAEVALCAVQLGVAEEALRRAAEYTGQRKQFGRAIATFQGVALRAADAFIDIEAMRATLIQAVWRLSEDLPAEREVASARWWACRGGHRVAHAVQHLHGGIGSDVDYPIHRYFLWAKQLGLTLGGANPQLARLGALICSDPTQEAS